MWLVSVLLIFGHCRVLIELAYKILLHVNFL
uniref:Uncharacterized protein n=1 Tax=Rhizophora mucronata TaxID=61149 RepID=A0A2P2NWV8_RHIMU